MSFDEEYIDPHGECAAEIHRLQALLTASEKRASEAERTFAGLHTEMARIIKTNDVLAMALRPFAEVPLLKHLEREAEGEIRIDEVRLYGAEIVGVAAYVKVAAFQTAQAVLTQEGIANALAANAQLVRERDEARSRAVFGREVRKLQSERDSARAALGKVVEALENARDKFLAYAAQHAAKNTSEGAGKSRHNLEMANMCDEAIRTALTHTGKKENDIS